MVGAEGLEPSSLAAYAPEAYAYTNSATHPSFVRDTYNQFHHLGNIIPLCPSVALWGEGGPHAQRPHSVLDFNSTGKHNRF